MKSYIILDRSGSMTTGWEETIGALEAYVSGDVPGKTQVFLNTFDDRHDEGVMAGTRVKDITSIKNFLAKRNIGPRGMTALFDAIGKMNILVDRTAKKKAQIIILTDGKENSSREVTRDGAKFIIDGWKAKGFDVVFVGADFDAFEQAGDVGIGNRDTINMKKGFASARNTGNTIAARAATYIQTGVAESFTDEDRAKAVVEDAK